MKAVTDDIRTVGWSVSAVLGDEIAPPWAYTVGLWLSHQGPELAMYGLPLEHMTVILNSVADRIANGAAIEAGSNVIAVWVGVDIIGTNEIPAAITNGDAHLGLAFEVKPRPELRRVAAARFRLGAVVRSDAAVAKAPDASFNELRDQPVILPKSNFANRGQLNPVMFQAGMTNREDFSR